MATEKQLTLIRELLDELDEDEAFALNILAPSDTPDTLEDCSVPAASEIIEALIEEKQERGHDR